MNKAEWLDFLISKFSTRTGVTFTPSPDSALSDMFAFLAEMFAYVSDLAKQEITLDPALATPDNVHKFISVTGFENVNGTNSTVVCDLTNEADDALLIPAGTRFSSGTTDDSYVAWELLEPVAINPGDTEEVTLYSVDKGAFNIGIGTLTNVVDNISDLTVTNTAISTPGLDPLRDEALVSYLLEVINNSTFGNAFHILESLKRATGLQHIKLFTNNTSTDMSIGTHTLEPGYMMIVVYPSPMSDSSFLLAADAFLKLIPPAVRVKTPIDLADGRSAYFDSTDGISIDFGVFYAQAVTFDIEVEVLTYTKKSNGVFYTLEEVAEPIKAQITNFINNVLIESPLGPTFYNARLQGAAVSVKGCADCVVRISVNGAASTVSNITLQAIQYPVIESFEIT